MHDACLHDRVRKGGLHGPAKARQTIAADEENVLDAALFELGQNAQPRLGPFRLSSPKTKDIAMTLEVDAERNIERALLHLATVTHRNKQRVEVDNWVDGIERPTLPIAHLLHHALGRFTDELMRHLGAVELAQMRLDVAHRHAARVEREHLFVEPFEPPLMLGKHDGLEASFAVARHSNRH